MRAKTVVKFSRALQQLSLAAGLALASLTPVGLISHAASAQDLDDKVRQLERQMRAVQRRVFEDEDLASGGGGDLRRLLADLNVKVAGVERQMRELTGRAEQLEFQNRQLRDDLDLLRRELQVQSASVPAPAAGAAGASGSTLPQGNASAAAPTPPAAAPTAVTLPDGSPAEQFDYAFGFVRDGDLERGRTALELFLEVDPEGPIKGNAQFWLGRVLLRQGRQGEAARYFLALVDSFPGHEKRPDALFELAQVLLDLDSPAEACSALAELLSGNALGARLKDRATKLAATAQCD